MRPICKVLFLLLCAISVAQAEVREIHYEQAFARAGATPSEFYWAQYGRFFRGSEEYSRSARSISQKWLEDLGVLMGCPDQSCFTRLPANAYWKLPIPASRVEDAKDAGSITIGEEEGDNASTVTENAGAQQLSPTEMSPAVSFENTKAILEAEKQQLQKENKNLFREIGALKGELAELNMDILWTSVVVLILFVLIGGFLLRKIKQLRGELLLEKSQSPKAGPRSDEIPCVLQDTVILLDGFHETLSGRGVTSDGHGLYLPRAYVEDNGRRYVYVPWNNIPVVFDGQQGELRLRIVNSDQFQEMLGIRIVSRRQAA